MNYLINQCIFPIMVGDIAVGQGFVADGYFITAAHVIKDNPSCFVQIGNKSIELVEEKWLFEGERDVWYDETQHDVIMCKMEGLPSPLHLSARKVTFDDVLRSYCMLLKFDSANNKYYNELSVKEATLKNMTGSNYMYCECERYEGSSGSPLLIDNEVVGIMHGGIGSTKLCAFLKVRSFILPPEERKPDPNLYNKPDEPLTPAYFNRRAREQMGDAFDGEGDAYWNVD